MKLSYCDYGFIYFFIYFWQLLFTYFKLCYVGPENLELLYLLTDWPFLIFEMPFLMPEVNDFMSR